jgi:hypothetical protein
MSKYKEDEGEEEEDRYTIRFRTASYDDIPLNNAFRASTQVTVTYVVWWNTLSANRWERPTEDVFKAFFSRGKAELTLEEDQKVLAGANVVEPVVAAKKLK